MVEPPQLTSLVPCASRSADPPSRLAPTLLRAVALPTVARATDMEDSLAEAAPRRAKTVSHRVRSSANTARNLIGATGPGRLGPFPRPLDAEGSGGQTWALTLWCSTEPTLPRRALPPRVYG